MKKCIDKIVYDEKARWQYCFWWKADWQNCTWWKSNLTKWYMMKGKVDINTEVFDETASWQNSAWWKGYLTKCYFLKGLVDKVKFNVSSCWQKVFDERASWQNGMWWKGCGVNTSTCF